MQTHTVFKSISTFIAGAIFAIGFTMVGIAFAMPQINLQYDVTSVLPIINGGTGNASGVAPNATSAAYATNAGTASNVPYSGLTGSVPTWNQNTTGTAAAASALAATPANCGAGNYATGINAAGSAVGCASAAGAYQLPAATSTVLGGTKPDGTTITNNAGAISVTYGTTAGTAAQGNDSRITGAVQSGGALGTPSSGTATNLTGTAAGLTAGNTSNVSGQTAAAVAAAAVMVQSATASNVPSTIVMRDVSGVITTNVVNGIYFPSYFGITPQTSCSGADQTAGFAKLTTFYQNLMAGQRSKIIWPAGFYPASGIALLPSSLTGAGIYPTLDWEGAGTTETVFCPTTNALTSSVFFSAAASFMQNPKITGIGFVGNSANAKQDGVAIYADVLTTNSTGGLSVGSFDQIAISGFTGRQFWTKGGTYNYNFPIQFLKFDTVNFQRPAGNPYPVIEQLGQTGQELFTQNSQFNGTTVNNNGGANVVISQDYRWQVISPISEYASSVITTPSYGASFWRGNSYNYPSETPLRIVPVQGQTFLLPITNPPIATGTTYWLERFNLWGDQASGAGTVARNDTDFTLSTTGQNAGVTYGTTNAGNAVNGTTLTLAATNGSLAAGQNITIGCAGSFNSFRTGGTAGMCQYAPFTTAISSVAGTTVTLYGSAPTAASGTVANPVTYSATPNITITTAGTPASYQFVPLWSAPPVSGVDGALNTLTYSENHRLITGDPMMPVGLTTNIQNAGLTISTVYYVRRTNHTQWQLFTTYASAVAVTTVPSASAVALSGNSTDWNNFGFVLGNGTTLVGTNSATVPYTIGMNATSQQSETGFYWNAATNAIATLHCEFDRRCVEAYNQTNLTLVSGNFSGGNDAGKGSEFISDGINTFITITGNPEIVSFDRVGWAINNGAFNIDDNSPFWQLNDTVSYGTRIVGASLQVSVSSNALNISRAKTIFVNPSTNYIGGFQGNQYSGATLTTRCHTGTPYYCDFYNTGSQNNIAFSVNNQNLNLGGAFRLRLYSGAASIWRQSDTDINGWQLVGTTGNAKFWQYVPTATSTITGTISAGVLTVTATTNPLAPGMALSGGTAAGTIAALGSSSTTGLGSSTAGANTYLLTGSSGNNPTIAALSSVIATIGAGDVEVDQLINPITVAAPVGNAQLGSSTSTLPGQSLTYHLLQDATGFRALTWAAAFKNVPSNSSASVSAVTAVAGGTITATMATGLNVTLGESVLGYLSAGNYLTGTLTAYAPTTGVATINVISVTGTITAATVTPYYFGVAAGAPNQNMWITFKNDVNGNWAYQNSSGWY